MKAKTMAHFDFAHLRVIVSFIICCAALPFLAGCKTEDRMSEAIQSLKSERSPALVLSEGDSLKITFPSSPNFNTSQPIRRDGKLALPVVGEVVAAGKTPTQLEKELTDLFSKQIVSSDQITVEVLSSAFPVFVVGAVLRPGKVLSDRPITALEAVLESGGFDPTKANLKKVRILRNQEGMMQSSVINLKRTMSGVGQTNQVFYLTPYDIVYVPEKFSWF